MIRLKCPTCGLEWNVHENSPASVTCPRCLTAVANPGGQPLGRAGPLPVLPPDHEVKRDEQFTSIGVWLILTILGIGILVFFVRRTTWGTGEILFAMAVPIVALVAGFIASQTRAKASRGAGQQVVEPRAQ